MIILGKSEGTITMILDNLESCNLFPLITIINNLSLPEKLPYRNPRFTIQEVIHLSDANQKGIIGSDEFILGVYDPQAKKKLCDIFEIEKERYINIRHHSAQISTTTVLGKGIIVCSCTSIAANTKIGNYVFMNRNSSVGHHTVIEDFVTVSPAAIICGNVRIEEGAMIGAGAVIIDGITIGANSVIGAGSVVTKNVEEGVIGYGNPFKVARKLI